MKRAREEAEHVASNFDLLCALPTSDGGGDDDDDNVSASTRPCKIARSSMTVTAPVTWAQWVLVPAENVAVQCAYKMYGRYQAPPSQTCIVSYRLHSARPDLHLDEWLRNIVLPHYRPPDSKTRLYVPESGLPVPNPDGGNIPLYLLFHYLADMDTSWLSHDLGAPLHLTPRPIAIAPRCDLGEWEVEVLGNTIGLLRSDRKLGAGRIIVAQEIIHYDPILVRFQAEAEERAAQELAKAKAAKAKAEGEDALPRTAPWQDQ